MTKEVMIFTKKGKVIRILVGDFPIQNRNGVGISAIQLREGDEVVSAIAIERK